MPLSPLAGKPAPAEILVDLARLERDYFDRQPDADNASEQVSFGTSGHRGSSLRGSFNEAHILAITQAICEYRRTQNIDGPLYMGKDTHALSAPAQQTALEVLAANGIHTIIQADDGWTPTPVISRSILVHNRDRNARRADGIVITPSHNPPDDGGFKYNPPDGGPADTQVTKWIQNRANELLRIRNQGVQRVAVAAALKASTTQQQDLIQPYVDDLENVIDMPAIRDASLKLAVDPLGGAGVRYWDRINARYGINIDVVNPRVDATFAFMTVDHDGKIRMDCSSPYAMAGLVRLKEFITTVSNDVTSKKRYHPNLYGKLARALKEAGVPGPHVPDKDE
jgi:phosphoglucomutase